MDVVASLSNPAWFNRWVALCKWLQVSSESLQQQATGVYLARSVLSRCCTWHTRLRSLARSTTNSWSSSRGSLLSLFALLCDSYTREWFSLKTVELLSEKKDRKTFGGEKSCSTSALESNKVKLESSWSVSLIKMHMAAPVLSAETKDTLPFQPRCLNPSHQQLSAHSGCFLLNRARRGEMHAVTWQGKTKMLLYQLFTEASQWPTNLTAWNKTGLYIKHVMFLLREPKHLTFILAVKFLAGSSMKLKQCIILTDFLQWETHINMTLETWLCLI